MVLLLNPRLVAFVWTGPGELDAVTEAVLDQRRVHEFAAVVDIQVPGVRRAGSVECVRAFPPPSRFHALPEVPVQPMPTSIRASLFDVTPAVDLFTVCDKIHLHAAARPLRTAKLRTGPAKVDRSSMTESSVASVHEA